MYDYLVTFSWYSSGELKIKSANVTLDSQITKETKVADILKCVDK